MFFSAAGLLQTNISIKNLFKIYKQVLKVLRVTVFLLVYNTYNIAFDSCSALDLSCEIKKIKKEKYLQITNCCLWESHSSGTTETTG